MSGRRLRCVRHTSLARRVCRQFSFENYLAPPPSPNDAREALALGEPAVLGGYDVTGLVGKFRPPRGSLLASSALAVVVAAMASVPASKAQDATWLANPGSGDFNT